MGSDALSRLERELFAHSGWVRRLARSLTRSESDAEDLVQDTWVAALRRPPEEGSAARPWLTRVVRNLAARRWRRHEVALEDSNALASPAAEEALDSAERLEVQRILVEEMQALAEPARRVILLRYFDGLDSAEIARRTGEPHGTVRWRLHEALAELRTRLDRRHGGARERWLSALTFGSPPSALMHAPPRSSQTPSHSSPHTSSAPHTVPHLHPAPLVPASLSVPTGVLAVNSLAKIGIAAAVVLALSVGVYVAIQDPQQPLEAAAPVALHDAQTEKSAPAKHDDKLQLGETTTAPMRAAVEAPLSNAPTTIAAKEQSSGIVVARCIDEALRPVAGAWLKRTSSDASPVQVDTRGEVRLEIDRPNPTASYAFSAGAADFATRWMESRVKVGETTYLGDIVLSPGGSVSGRVIDREGVAVGGAEVVVTPPTLDDVASDFELMRVRGPQHELGRPTTKSAPDGRFSVDGVAVGLARVWARAAGMRWSVSEPIEIKAHHDTSGIELKLEPEPIEGNEFGPIEGLVLAPDETPVKTPRISVSHSMNNMTRSTEIYGDEKGHFRIVPLGRSPHDLRFGDKDSRWTSVHMPAVPPGTRGLIVRLSEPKIVALVVKSKSTPVTQYHVTWREPDDISDHPDRSDKERPEGRMLLKVPAATFTFTIVAVGFLTKEMGPYDGRNPPVEVEVELEAVPGVQGVVLAAGQPVAGARVLSKPFARHAKVSVNEFDWYVEPSDEVATTTDAQGRFRLGVQRDGEFMLFAESGDYARSELGPIEYVASRGAGGFVLNMDVGGAIEGRVLMPPGRSPAGVIVGVNHGDGKPRTSAVGPDGRYRFEHLTAGSWLVKRCQSEYVSGTSTAISSGDDIEGGKIDTNCAVVAGTSTVFDLDLRNAQPCALDLELRLNGESAKAWRATLLPSGPYALTHGPPEGATDFQGRVRLEADDPGEYRLHLVPPPEMNTALEIDIDVSLVHGSTPLARDLKTGRVEGAIASWSPDLQHGWRYHSAGKSGLDATMQIRADDAGHFALPMIPEGAGSIEHDEATEPHSMSWKSVVQLLITAGSTQSVSVP